MGRLSSVVAQFSGSMTVSALFMCTQKRKTLNVHQLCELPLPKRPSPWKKEIQSCTKTRWHVSIWKPELNATRVFLIQIVVFQLLPCDVFPLFSNSFCFCPLAAWYRVFKALITISGLCLIGAILLGFIYIFCKGFSKSWVVAIILVILLISGVWLCNFLSHESRVVVSGWLNQDQNKLNPMGGPTPVCATELSFLANVRCESWGLLIRCWFSFFIQWNKCTKDWEDIGPQVVSMDDFSWILGPKVLHWRVWPWLRCRERTAEFRGIGQRNIQNSHTTSILQPTWRIRWSNFSLLFSSLFVSIVVICGIVSYAMFAAELPDNLSISYSFVVHVLGTVCIIFAIFSISYQWYRISFTI